MTLQELENQILALPPVQKAEIFQLLTQSFSDGARGITKTPGVVGGDACVAGTRIPVWSLVLDQRLGASDVQILESFPQLTAAELVNVWAYANAHSDEIDAAIQDNEAAMHEED